MKQLTERFTHGIVGAIVVGSNVSKLVFNTIGLKSL